MLRINVLSLLVLSTTLSLPSYGAITVAPSTPPPPPKSYLPLGPYNPHDYPATPPNANPWAFENGFPVSWKAALALDIFVLVVTLSALIFLGWYIRRQYLRRRSWGTDMAEERRLMRRLRRSPRKFRGRMGVWEAEVERKRWRERGRRMAGDEEEEEWLRH